MLMGFRLTEECLTRELSYTRRSVANGGIGRESSDNYFVWFLKFISLLASVLLSLSLTWLSQHFVDRFYLGSEALITGCGTPSNCSHVSGLFIPS